LTPLMDRSRGRSEVTIGLIDGPVALDHPALARDQIRELRGRGASNRPNGNASLHGVFVAGILSAERGSPAPVICPDYTLLVRPVFGETPSIDDTPSTTPAELAQAVVDCISAGARVLNISAALAPPFLKNEQTLEKH
jgi:subtilisin family serine protease